MQRTWILGLAAVALLAACDNDPTGTTGDAMSRAEALAVAGSIGGASVEATTDGITEITQSGGADAGAFSFSQTTSHPCPQGGRIQVVLGVDAEYDQSTSSFELNAEGTLTHDECALDADGTVFTFNGDPSLAYSAFAAAQNGVASAPWTNTVMGAFAWSAADGREGRCAIDLAVVTDLIAQERTVVGNVCDHTIEQHLSWQ